MAVPKKQISLLIDLMEALSMDGTSYDTPPRVEIIPHDEVYVGYFDTTVIDKLISMGVIELLGLFDDERQLIKLVERDDFLSSWAAGVNEARNGQDLHYADYSNHQLAFSAGYEHWHNRNKKALKGKLTHYSRAIEYVCHGFLCQESQGIHQQH